jgi:predicted Zn finger-like uncharacterized protein
MKTRCPNCQTVFRVTPEQIKARTGKVRCGHCRTVFNALDNLFDEEPPGFPPKPSGSAATHAGPVDEPETPVGLTREISLFFPANELQMEETPAAEEGELPPLRAVFPEPNESIGLDEPPEPSLSAGLIFPRETSEIPGYSKWTEGIMAPPIAFPAERPSRRSFCLVAAGLALTLIGQAAFHFRGELAISMPSLRPALEVLSRALNGPIPLPRRVDLISIETSDLQADTAKGNLLVLNTTLRNNAAYGQAYPSMELSLTDMQDMVIARRIFPPQDYLPAKSAADSAFPGNSSVTVRLWIDAVDLAAAGYHLLVFYP